MIQIPITNHNLFNILREVSEIFTLEPAVIHTDAAPILIVADLHGDMKALWSALRKRTDLGCDTVIFLGDYIDRGSESLDVLEKVFSLKIAEPDKIILLRGNHELKETNRFEKLFEDLEYDEDLFTSINNVFDEMPVSAVISDKVFCVHAGIPGHVKLSEITKEGAYPFVWNDPSEIDGIGESSRGLGMRTFGEDVFDEFLWVNGLERMVRGHSVVEGGFKWWFDGRLLSIDDAVGVVGKDNLKVVETVNIEH
ncbi:MAG: serine/threonine protein phosphatase [Methanosarcinales archaeon]|nr:serine/threonine protein phosphatase [Methanosarcinales archaeon]